MTILVTGGGGFLGTVLIRRLLKDNYGAIRVLDIFSWGTQPLVSVLPSRRTVEILRGDVRDRGTLEQALDGVDVIVHLAGIVGYPACDADPHGADSTNVEATQLLCELAGGRRVVFASTGSCYGKIDSFATEDTPINPLTRYGRNKADGERAVLDAGGVCLRLATLFGLSPRMRWDLLPHDFARRAVTTGSLAVYEPHARRTFLHIEDAVEAFLWALSTWPPGVYNVGDERQNYTKGEVAALIQQQTGCQVTEIVGHDPDQRDYNVRFDKIMAHGFAAKQTFRRFPDILPTLLDVARVWT